MKAWAILELFVLTLLRDLVFTRSRNLVTVGTAVYFMGSDSMWKFDAGKITKV